MPLSFCLFLFLLLIFLFLFLWLYLPLQHCFYLCLSDTFCRSVCLSVCLSFHPTLSCCLYVSCLSICLSVLWYKFLRKCWILPLHFHGGDAVLPWTLLWPDATGELSCSEGNTSKHFGYGEPHCPTYSGSFIVPILLGVHVMITHVLLLNLLIARFGSVRHYFYWINKPTEQHADGVIVYVLFSYLGNMKHKIWGMGFFKALQEVFAFSICFIFDMQLFCLSRYEICKNECIILAFAITNWTALTQSNTILTVASVYIAWKSRAFTSSSRAHWGQ